VVTAAAHESEAILFEFLAKGNPLVDSTGRGLIMDVDRAFRWKINNIDGHYYYAYSTEERIDLAAKKEGKKFISAMQEGLKGQSVYLKRLSSSEVADISEALQMRRILEAGTVSTGPRVRSRMSDSTSELVSDLV